jgi:hypothetical protein
MKEMVLTFYRQHHVRPDWLIDVQLSEFQTFLAELVAEMQRFAINLTCVHTDAFTIDIQSYADLLNAVRISSPSDTITNVCIGHIIGKSERLDLREDIKRAVTRIAFAPETVAPDEHARRVCHNCGCGC